MQMARPELTSSIEDAAREVVYRLGGDKFAADVLIERAKDISYSKDRNTLEIIIRVPRVKLTIGDGKTVKMDTFRLGSQKSRTEYLYEVDRILADGQVDTRTSTLNFRSENGRGFVITTKRVAAKVLSPSQRFLVNSAY